MSNKKQEVKKSKRKEKEAEAITFDELKKFCNSLNAGQLKQPVRWWGDERGGMILKAETLEEDYVNDDDYCSPISASPDFKEYPEDFPIVLTKGTPILNVD